MFALPELDDTNYTFSVLGLYNGETELDVDRQHQREASDLGVSLAKGDGSLAGQSSTSHSAVTVNTTHRRSQSSSGMSHSTGLTSHSSHSPVNDDLSLLAPPPLFTVTPRGLETSRSGKEFEHFLNHARSQPSFLTEPPLSPHRDSRSSNGAKGAPSLFSVSTRKSLVRMKKSFSRFAKFGKKDKSKEPSCCERDNKHKKLSTLKCAHQHCQLCIQDMCRAAAQDSTKMPPSCCNMPVPSTIVKQSLTLPEQMELLNSVVNHVRPWDERIVCPNTNCGQLISGRKIDPKHPSETRCRKCKTKVCKTCKGYTHPYGPECPSDWELEVVLALSTNQAWRRCYNCRSLVELQYGQTYMHCRCDSSFCYLCGAVCDSRLGCPNFCNGERELVRKIQQEEERKRRKEEEEVERQAVMAATAREAIDIEPKETSHPGLQLLRDRHTGEMHRFLDFEAKQRWQMWSRLGALKIVMKERHEEQLTNQRIKHHNFEQALEERQLAQEIELRTALKTELTACIRKLRHMEAYCNGLNATGLVPGRIVTERDLRELGQQYNIRDQMEQLHQSRINVMREKQSRNTEAMATRHSAEAESLDVRQENEAFALEEQRSDEEKTFANCFDARKERLIRRWDVEEELFRAKLKREKGVEFAPLKPIEWPQPLRHKRSSSV